MMKVVIQLVNLFQIDAASVEATSRPRSNRNPDDEPSGHFEEWGMNASDKSQDRAPFASVGSALRFEISHHPSQLKANKI